MGKKQIDEFVLCPDKSCLQLSGSLVLGLGLQLFSKCRQVIFWQVEDKIYNKLCKELYEKYTTS